MNVQSVNNQPNFGSIFVPRNSNFTAEQKKMADLIVNTLREPSKKFKNKTAEDYFKSKEKMDFRIKACNNLPDYVSLEGLKNPKIAKDGTITYKQGYDIGVYSEKHPFKTDDIESVIKVMDDEPKNTFIMPVFAGLLALLSVIGVKMSDKSQQVAKPLIETADTISTKAKTILPDTITKKTQVIKVIK